MGHNSYNHNGHNRDPHGSRQPPRRRGGITDPHSFRSPLLDASPPSRGDFRRDQRRRDEGGGPRRQGTRIPTPDLNGNQQEYLGYFSRVINYIADELGALSRPLRIIPKGDGGIGQVDEVSALYNFARNVCNRGICFGGDKEAKASIRGAKFYTILRPVLDSLLNLQGDLGSSNVPTFDLEKRLKIALRLFCHLHDDQMNSPELDSFFNEAKERISGLPANLRTIFEEFAEHKGRPKEWAQKKASSQTGQF